MATDTAQSNQALQLPPLILHPFADQGGPSKLVKSSRASLMLQGLLPSEDPAEELDRALLEGRYAEIRMLFYVGRDLLRWIEQCIEAAERDPDLRPRGLSFSSFAVYLVDQPPAPVKEKLQKWGVADYRAIFMRALGLNAIFEEVPPREVLSRHFVRHYYRYADQAYHTRLTMEPFPSLAAGECDFQLYASGEYSRMLEQQWR